MKKLLILMLVLGIASASYGSFGDIRDNFELWLDDGTLTVVGLQAVAMEVGVFDPDNESDGYQYSGSLTILADNQTPTPGYAAGALRGGVVYFSDGWDGIDFGTGDTSPSTDPIDVMDWYTVAYSGHVGDMMDIYDYDVSGETPVGQLEILPEPATVALLGLGGLFMLRRRK